METALNQTTSFTTNKASLWTGRIISAICVLFLLFDALGKIFLESHSVDGSAKVGIPHDMIQPVGVILLICMIVYLIPRTAILGAILLTGYLGGATAIMMRVGFPLYFSVVFSVLVWVGLALRDEKVRDFLLKR